MIFKLPTYFSKDVRIWNYIPNKPLSTAQTEHILKEGYKFSQSWQVHGAPLKAEVLVQNNVLISVIVDNAQAAASGCSIDKSVAFMQKMEQDLGIILLNRMNILYANAEEIHIGDHRKLQDIPAFATVFNHLTSDRAEYESPWPVLNESWLAPQLS